MRPLERQQCIYHNCDPAEASSEGYGQGFGQKLEEDVDFVRAQVLFYTDLASTTSYVSYIYVCALTVLSFPP